MRDVIRVERHPDPMTGTLDAAHEDARALIEAWEGPSIEGDSLAAVGRVADEVLPSIVARLAVSGLGEIEVRHRDWRIRVRRAAVPADSAPADAGTAADASPRADAMPVNPGSVARPSTTATSPAVGYAVPQPDLAVGARVAQGDVIGWVDVLGVRQDVVAPADGLLGKWVVAAGDPVEYGQELVQVVPGGPPPTRPATDGAET